MRHQGESCVNHQQLTSRRTAMRLRNCPPISVLTTPNAFTPPPLPSLRLRSTLPTCLQHSFPSLCSLPSRHASNTTYDPYACVVPSDTAYHPYACGVPSRHAPNISYHPYPCGVPSQHPPDTTYDPYACVVPSQHASDTAYHPYTCRVPSQHCLPSLCSCSALPTCLRQHLPSSLFRITSIVYSGLLAYTMNAIAKIC
ncbi:hypothetical protein O181_088827 [Austropuccinia psidii MF-1]|uniref:Uncharacterized protein n=1 Tax=Austropuccinia psidii MF-1 TaxID=1389203 RepID=A0A9Q3P5S5_9BASI|nr:hypothetical protein [Austropuccinia psidii MF-1]